MSDQNEYASFDSNTPNADDFADLASLDTAWEATEVSEDDLWSDPPDGTYQVVVVKAQLGRGKDKKDNTGNTVRGKAFLNWHLRITGPTYIGRMIFKKSYLTVATTRMVVTDLFRCGLRCNPSALKDRAVELIGLRLRVKKVNKGDAAYPDSYDINILTKLGKLDEEQVMDLLSTKNGGTKHTSTRQEEDETPF